MSRIKKYNSITGEWEYVDAVGDDASFVNYSSSATYPNGSVGKAISDLESDVSTQSSQISDLGTAESQTRGMISDAWTQRTYQPREYAIYNNKLWKCLVANSSAPSEGANWTAVSVSDELSDANEAIANKLEWTRVNMSAAKGGAVVDLPASFTDLLIQIDTPDGEYRTTFLNRQGLDATSRIFQVGSSYYNSSTYTFININANVEHISMRNVLINGSDRKNDSYMVVYAR